MLQTNSAQSGRRQLLDDYLTAPDGCRNYPWPTQRASREFPFQPALLAAKLRVDRKKTGNKTAQVGHGGHQPGPLEWRRLRPAIQSSKGDTGYLS